MLIANKLVRVVACNEELQLQSRVLLTSGNILDMFYLHLHKINGYYGQHGKVVTCREGLPSIELHDHLNKWSSVRSHNKSNALYLHLQNAMSTKLDKVVNYHDRLLPLKSHDPLIK